MLSSPNVYKFNQVVLQDNDARVIDSNERMAERIAALSRSLQESIGDMDGAEFTDEFTDGIEATQVSMLLDEDAGNVIKAEPVYDGPSPEELIAEAEEQIGAMMNQAAQEAEQLRAQAYEEGVAKGQSDGYAKGYSEAEALKVQLRQEYEEKEEQLIRIYQDKIREIEPSLVDVLTDIYEHVFHVKMSDQRDVIMHLLGNALRKELFR